MCFPVFKKKKEYIGETVGIVFYSFYQSSKDNDKTAKQQEEEMVEIILKSKPDIVHIWGTENRTTLTMVNTCKKMGMSNRVIISMQGISSLISKHYLLGIPYNVAKKYSFRDLIKRENILKQKDKYQKRGEYEVQALKKVMHVIGRTEWDHAFSIQTNSSVNYYQCNESLRSSFYNAKWSLEKCRKYTLFMSQSNYPIKGLHYALEAIALLKKAGYTEVLLNIAGSDVTRRNEGVKGLIKKTYYGIYIERLIKKMGLESNVCFLGNLSEEQICKQYLKSHVFISPSLVENESNSLSEAKMVGVPSVASYVGGVVDRINHGNDGFFYQHDAPYMLAYYVDKIFRNNELSLALSQNARINSRIINDREKNKTTMLEIYKKVLEYDNKNL